MTPNNRLTELESAAEDSGWVCSKKDDEDEDDNALPGDALAAYYAEEPTGTGEIVFDESIGLSVEAMREEVTLNSLWNVL